MTTATDSGPRRTRRWNWTWIEAYRLLLFLLILAYYNALLAAVFALFRFGLVAPDAAWLEAPWKIVLFIVYLGLAIPLAVQVLRHLWRGIRGLVTEMHDTAHGQIDGRRLSREEYPELYAAVASVAARVAAPSPDEVWVTHRAECYVTELRWFALFTDRRLILVLGMPHLSVLSVDELQAILAHELAHFRRGDTSLGVFIFRFLEMLRVEMDRFAGRAWRWLNPLYLAENLYFHAFLFLSAPIRRYQELRADSLCAAAYGGEMAARTLLKEWLLASQFDAAVAAFEPADSATDDGRETVFDALTRRWRGLSAEGQAYLERRLLEEERSGFFDSHPTVAVRLQTMRAFPPSGCPDQTPARCLIHDFADLERELHATLLRHAAR